MIAKLFHRFEEALKTSVKASGQSMVIAGATATIIFVAYGVLWLYVTPLAHESLELRLIGALLGLLLWLSPR